MARKTNLPWYKNKKVLITSCFAMVFFALLYIHANRIILDSDKQCISEHSTKLHPPVNPKTAQEFLALGDYHFESGNCKQAITDYTQAVTINSNYAEAYNNRAYTNMRLHDYKDALSDLDKAIAINPNYVTALMNRGDIYNYYYHVDRQKAIVDYNRVIALGRDKDKSGSVCGHRAMAETHNMIPLVILRAITHTDCP